MKNTLLLSLFFVFSLKGVCEKTTISVSITNYILEYKDANLTYTISKGQEVLTNKQILEPVKNLEVEPGAYKVHLIHDLQDTLMVWNRLIVKKGNETEFNLWFDYDKYTNADDSIMGIKTESNHGISIIDNQGSSIDYGFNINGIGSIMFIASKNLSFGFGLGWNYRNTKISDNSSLFPEYEPKKEVYRTFGVNTSAFCRLSFYDNYKPFKLGFHLDFGATYILPLWYRHITYGQNNLKQFESKIVRFNDLAGFVKIGFHPISIFAEYRPFDIIMGDRPQESNLRFGVMIDIPTI